MLKIIAISFMLLTFSSNVVAEENYQPVDKYEKIRKAEKTVQDKFKAEKPIFDKNRLKNRKLKEILKAVQ